MPFDMNQVPTTLNCPYCGHTIKKQLSLTERFEALAATILKAQIAPAGTPGYDLYDSELFPGMTFQIKVSSGPDWQWHSKATEHADWYICFGILNDLIVFPFAFSTEEWAETTFLSSDNRWRNLRISYGRKGRQISRGYGIRHWPDDFLARIAQT